MDLSTCALENWVNTHWCTYQEKVYLFSGKSKAGMLDFQNHHCQAQAAHLAGPEGKEAVLQAPSALCSTSAQGPQWNSTCHTLLTLVCGAGLTSEL